jgi:glycosyltransferase involved in cell wall biosynthesis
VTTNYGEIRSYFINQKNAVVAQKYDVEEYARAMEYALQDPERAADIGHNGKQLALREFDHLVQGRRIKAFIESLLKFKGVELRHDQPGIGV